MAMLSAVTVERIRMVRALCYLLLSISYCTAFKSTRGLQRKQLCNHSHRDRRSQLFALVPIKLITDNRKSGFEYEFTERYEAGVMLTGTEVKSCRKGMVQLSDSMAEIIDGECWLLNCHIAEHDRCGRLDQHKPKRSRKLLLNKKEILKLEQRVLQRNCEIIPIRMFFSEKNFVKIELGVGIKKTMGDKRDGEMKKEGERDIRRTMKGGSYD